MSIFAVRSPAGTFVRCLACNFREEGVCAFDCTTEPDEALVLEDTLPDTLPELSGESKLLLLADFRRATIANHEESIRRAVAYLGEDKGIEAYLAQCPEPVTAVIY